MTRGDWVENCLQTFHSLVAQYSHTHYKLLHLEVKPPANWSTCDECSRKVWLEIEPPIILQLLDFLPGGLH